jgi:hypothetical protein
LPPPSFFFIWAFLDMFEIHFIHVLGMRRVGGVCNML